MATFGQTGDQASSSTSSADSVIMNKAADAASTPATNGTLDSVIARVWVSGTGSTVGKGVIYSEAGNLLATGDEVSITNNSEQEVTFPFSGAERIALTAGTKYNYGIIYNDPGTENFTWSRGGTSNASWKYSDTYEDGPASTIGSGTVSGPIDIYVSYTESGGTDVTVSAGVQSKTIAVQAPTVSATRNPTVTPSTLSKTIAVQAPTVSTTRSVTVTPAAVSSQANVLAPTVSTVRNVTVLPDALGSSFTVQAPSLSIGETLQPSAISSVFSIPSPTITTTRSVTVSPSVVTGTINLLSPAYSGPESINVTVTPQPIEIGRRTYVYDDDYNRYKRIFGDIYIQE